MLIGLVVIFMLVKNIFPAWLAGFFIVWLYLLFTTTGVGVYFSHWLYAVMMIFGAAIAGFTPVGGGAVAYPILSLYTDLTPQIARDFSLAIQSIGMISASIYIITRKSYSWLFFRQLPWYITFNFIGFIAVTALYSLIPITWIQMMFVSLAVAFIGSFMFTKQYGVEKNVTPTLTHKMIFGLAGGACAALFGTGSDMLIYIMLSVYYGQCQKQATDISIVTMAIMSVLGIAYKGMILHDISPQVYPMWIAAAPIVAVFAPFGNKLLTMVKTYTMLLFVLGLNVFNYIYWSSQNHSLILPSILCIITFILWFNHVKYRNNSSISNSNTQI